MGYCINAALSGNVDPKKSPIQLLCEELEEEDYISAWCRAKTLGFTKEEFEELKDIWSL